MLFFRRGRFFQACFLGAATPTVAQGATEGPRILFESSLTPRDATSPRDSTVRDRVSHRRFHFYSPIPLPGEVLGGRFVTQFTFSREWRKTERGALGRATSFIGTGLTWLENDTRGNVRMVFSGARYTGAHWRGGATGALWEALGGGLLDELPWLASSVTSSGAYAVLRYRRFPYAHRFLPFFGLSARWGQGVFVDAGYPTHVQLGWKNSHESLLFVGGLQVEGRESAGRQPELDVWVEGYSMLLFVGSRFVVAPPVHLRIESGYQTERLVLRERSGNVVREDELPWAPVIRLGVTTVFP